MSRRITLLTAHKGVDLHAATAVRVMRERLEGGDRLVALHRCELHTFVAGDGDAGAGAGIARLLDNGRYYNPNKHHYGHFAADGAEPWTDAAGGLLPAAWPGEAAGTDLAALAGDGAALYARLLGGPLPADRTAVDVAAWPREQDGPVTSGVLWRLVLDAPRAAAAALGDTLAVARGRKRGLLINPHMEAWRAIVR
ncbi:MAG: hypothetical protein R6X35_03095 [Candidatus Krumholzibacteriia bacterium]